MFARLSLSQKIMIAIDWSKQQAFDAGPKVIHQINFTGNLDRAGNTAMLFIIKEAKETILDFLRRDHESIVNFIWLNIRSI